MLPSAGVRGPASGGRSRRRWFRRGWWKEWEILKTRKRGNKACDPVRSQPQVQDVELRRMGEAMEEVIGGVWFPTAAFGASWIYGWVDQVLVAVQGFAKP